MARLAGHDGGLGQLFGFLIAGVVFVGVIGAVLLIADDTSNVEPAASRRTVEATTLLATLVESPGQGWEAGPDSITRLGLANTSAGPLMMHTDHLETLRGALEESDPVNGLVDYREAHESLGIPEGTEFHFRIRPISLAADGNIGLGHLKVAYVGEWDTLDGITVSLGLEADMLDAAQAGLDAQASLFTENERFALQNLGFDFVDDVYIGSVEPEVMIDLSPLPDVSLTAHLSVSEIDGDVYPGDKGYIDEVLHDRLAIYDILVIGSGVDQSTLTTAVTKDAIRDFVLEGGVLIVFGSESQNFQWLQPLFSVGTTTVNGGAIAPDPLHPILNEPNELQWGSYDNHGLGWDLKDQGADANYDDFEHVVTDDNEDTFAFSKTGAFGEGTIIVTTWWPKELNEEISEIEDEAFLENIVLYFDRERLRLEYGLPIPTAGAEVAFAVREVIIPDAELGNVPARAELHLWSYLD